MQENLSSGLRNNKGADQPAHLCSLISTCIIRLLESILSELATSEISFFYSAGLFEYYFVANSQDRSIGILGNSDTEPPQVAMVQLLLEGVCTALCEIC